MLRVCVIAMVVALYAVMDPVQAQQQPVFVYGFVGGYGTLTDLDGDVDASFGSAVDVGAGLGISLSKLVALRGDVTYVKNDGDDARTVPPNLNGSYTRYVVGADVQLRLPLGAIAPYVFGGVGAAMIDPELDAPATESEGDRFTKLAGRFSAGLHLALGTQLGVFGQAMGWMYEFDRVGFDTSQIDVTYNIGVTVGLGR